MAGKTNIILIGMPGVGKSTVGILLAKVLSRGFIDTDVYIQARQGQRLQEIIDEQSMEAFCVIENQAVAELIATNAVIATGGSVIYYESAMRHLADSGIIVLLTLPPEKLVARLHDIVSRGVVIKGDQNFFELYHERKPLYEQWADITIDCSGKNHEDVVAAIIEGIDSKHKERP